MDPEGTVNPAAAETVDTTPAQPAEFTVPDGQMLIGKDEWDSTNRNASRASGMQAFYDAARNAGFQGADDFGRHSDLQSVLRTNGLSNERLMSILSESEPQPNGEPASLTMEDVNQKIEEALKGERHGHALTRHEEGRKSEGKYLDELLGEFVGADAGEEWTEFAKMAATGHLWDKRSSYEEGHPLRGETLSNYDSASMRETLGPFGELLQKVRATPLAEIGDAALKPSPSTPAARRGGGGPAKDDDDGSRTKMSTNIREKLQQALG